MLTNLLSSAIIVKMSADFLKGETMHTDIVEQIQKVMRESVESSEVTGVNLLVEKDDRIFLSRTGILVSNAVMADFLL